MPFRPVFVLSPKATPEEVEKWVDSIDIDGDGAISDQELKKALQELNLWCPRLRCGREMKRADFNHDGKINTEAERKALLKHAQDHWGRKIANHNRNLHRNGF